MERMAGHDLDALRAAVDSHAATMHSRGFSAQVSRNVMDAFLGGSQSTTASDVRRFTTWAMKAMVRYPGLNPAALPITGHLVPRTEHEAVMSYLYGTLIRIADTVPQPAPQAAPDADEVPHVELTGELAFPLATFLSSVRDEFCEDFPAAVGKRQSIILSLLTPHVVSKVIPVIEPFVGTDNAERYPHYLRLALVGDVVADTLIEHSDDPVTRMAANNWLNYGRDQIHQR